jgi:hypothetical protein
MFSDYHTELQLALFRQAELMEEIRHDQLVEELKPHGHKFHLFGLHHKSQEQKTATDEDGAVQVDTAK